jgi:hypothetical protein
MTGAYPYWSQKEGYEADLLIKALNCAVSNHAPGHFRWFTELVKQTGLDAKVFLRRLDYVHG